MSLDFIGNQNNYKLTTGDTLLAQTSRIYQLVTGKLPANVPTNGLSNGSVSYSLGTSQMNNTSQALYTNAEDIQTSIGALGEARSGLEMIMTRINVLNELGKVVDKYPDMSYTQRLNINDQVNYALTEIDDISKTQKFSDTYLLDGTIEKNGAVMKFAGGDTIDLTDAFKETSPEKLGLPRQGEAFVRTDTLDQFFSQISTAVDKVQNQVDTIDSLQNSLYDKFDAIKSTIYDTKNTIQNNTSFSSQNALGGNYGSMKVGTELFLTMGSVQSTVMTNDDFYQRILALLDKQNSG